MVVCVQLFGCILVMPKRVGEFLAFGMEVSGVIQPLLFGVLFRIVLCGLYGGSGTTELLKGSSLSLS